MLSRPTVVCFGEVLWDLLPTGALPGGSNLNVAYHLRAHGVGACLVSAVGRDEIGDQLIAFIRGKGIRCDGIARVTAQPTGTVQVTVDASGDAHYHIRPAAAWDNIPADASLSATARADALVFSSLAQRSPHNRRSLDRLLRILPAGAWRVFDVNLRAPHDELSVVGRLAKQATIIKVNAAEAARITGIAAESGAEESQARALAAGTGCRTIILTSGARGAGLLKANRWHWESGRAVEVVDTVGAGDAFLAALLAGLIAREDDACILAHACRIGEWVASQPGAMPVYGQARARQSLVIGARPASGI